MEISGPKKLDEHIQLVLGENLGNWENMFSTFGFPYPVHFGVFSGFWFCSVFYLS